MRQRRFGKTNKMVSEIGLGTWQLGTRWGDPFNKEEGLKILQAAYDGGITLIDTADIYLGGNSERTIGEFIKNYPNHFYIVTKCGRGLKPHTADMYTPEAIENFVDGSINRLGVPKLDMVLLHCPPTPVFSKDEIFAKLDELKAIGKISDYGVSVETVDEALQAMKYDISAIEVIFNMFRLKPTEVLFKEAKKRDIAIIARVPLASGLLTGKFSKDTYFGDKDHRKYNRNGESFSKGETFSGVDYELGLEAVDELKKLFNTDNLVPYALRWILMHDAVSVVIPGASKEQQVIDNVKAMELEKLTDEEMKKVEEIYNKYIKESVHNEW